MRGGLLYSRAEPRVLRRILMGNWQSWYFYLTMRPPSWRILMGVGVCWEQRTMRRILFLGAWSACALILCPAAQADQFGATNGLRTVALSGMQEPDTSETFGDVGYSGISL